MEMNKEILVKLGLVAAVVLVGTSVTMLIKSRNKRTAQLASQQVVRRKQEQTRI